MAMGTGRESSATALWAGWTVVMCSVAREVRPPGGPGSPRPEGGAYRHGVPMRVVTWR
jgi:hypothetical protein